MHIFSGMLKLDGSTKGAAGCKHVWNPTGRHAGEETLSLEERGGEGRRGGGGAGGLPCSPPLMEVLRRAPWGHVVHDHLVEVVDGDDVLGSLLVIGDTGVLEPVTPQDLVGKVRRSNL